MGDARPAGVWVCTTCGRRAIRKFARNAIWLGWTLVNYSTAFDRCDIIRINCIRTEWLLCSLKHSSLMTIQRNWLVMYSTCCKHPRTEWTCISHERHHGIRGHSVVMQIDETNKLNNSAGSDTFARTGAVRCKATYNQLIETRCHVHSFDGLTPYRESSPAH